MQGTTAALTGLQCPIKHRSPVGKQQHSAATTQLSLQPPLTQGSDPLQRGGKPQPRAPPSAHPAALTVEDAGLRDVPDGCGLHDVPDDELLDGFVLGDAAGAVGAADGLDVAAALLGPTVVPPLLRLRWDWGRGEGGGGAEPRTAVSPPALSWRRPQAQLSLPTYPKPPHIPTKTPMDPLSPPQPPLQSPTALQGSLIPPLNTLSTPSKTPTP